MNRNTALLSAIVAPFLLIAHAATIAAATIYYVDASAGNDSNNGTSSELAWKTIAKVSSLVFDPGDQILFRKGRIWREQLNIPSSGAVGQPIVFGSYGDGDQPIFSGSDVVNGWSNYDSSIWKASLTTEPHQVFFDGQPGNRQTSLSDLHTSEDWYWYENTLYVVANADPETTFLRAGVEASVRDSAIVVQGKDNIMLSGLHVTQANANGINGYQRSNAPIIDAVKVDYSYLQGLLWSWGESQNNGIVRNSEFSYNGAIGCLINDHADGWLIEKNKFHHNGRILTGHPNHEWTAGYKSWGANESISHFIIQDNESYSNGFPGIADNKKGNGIWLDETAGPNIVRRNRIYDNNSRGIYVEKSNGVSVAYNLVFNNGKYSTAYIGGIHVKSGYDNMIYNNTSYNNGYAGIVVNTAGGSEIVQETLVRNNVSVKNRYQLWINVGGNNDGINGSRNIYEYNCLGIESPNFLSWGYTSVSTIGDLESLYGKPTYSVTVDPLLSNPGTGNFSLQNGSKCIGAAPYFSDDIDINGTPIPSGGNVSMGAIEQKRISHPENFRLVAAAQ